MKILKLAPLFLPPPEYFRLMGEVDIVILDEELRHDRRMKSMHRTVLSGSAGASLLTVPVSSPKKGGRSRWSDVRVSPHGRWWHVHQLTMATLYGPTPFFDMYKYDFFPLLDSGAVGRSITDFNIDLILTVRRLTGNVTPLSMGLDPRYERDSSVEIIDMRFHDFYADSSVRSVIESLFRGELQ